MSHDFLIADVGGEQGGVDALSEVCSFSGFEHVPFSKVLLQLLHMLLIQQLDALNVIL